MLKAGEVAPGKGGSQRALANHKKKGNIYTGGKAQVGPKDTSPKPKGWGC